MLFPSFPMCLLRLPSMRPLSTFGMFHVFDCARATALRVMFVYLQRSCCIIFDVLFTTTLHVAIAHVEPDFDNVFDGFLRIT